MYVSDVHASRSGMTTLLRDAADVSCGEDARSLRFVGQRRVALPKAFTYSEVEKRKKGEVSLKALAMHILRANAQILIDSIDGDLFRRVSLDCTDATGSLRCGDKFGARMNVFAAHYIVAIKD